MLRVYGVGGKLLKAVQSIYLVSRTCVWVGNDTSEWFLVNVGLRLGCVMSPWLFNVLGFLKWLELLSVNDSRLEINQQLFEDDAALVTD